MTELLVTNLLVVAESDAAEHYVRHVDVGAAQRWMCTARVSEACLLARGQAVDAVLVDAATLGADEALRLTQWMRREVPALPIVLVDRAAPGQRLYDALELGVIDYLRAPAAPQDVSDALGRAVRWKRDVQTARDADERTTREMLARADALVRASVEIGIESARSLKAWLEHLYERDGWTADHVRRVADLSVLIGRMLGVDARMLDEIERTALLHDVGRLAVPDRLLRKPGPLTDEERVLMRTHVQVAYEIAAASPYLEPVADALFAVRERFDGSGYPLGLRGEAIPLPARIIAVAEGLDTLGSVREPDPAARDVINATLVRSAGASFDPAVVRAWLKCVDAGAVDGRVSCS